MANKERIWIFGRTVLLNYVILLFLGSWSILFLSFGSWRVLLWDPAGKAIDQKCFCSWDFLCYRLIRKMSIPILFSLHGSLLMDGNPPFTIWVWDWYWWSWPFIGVFSTHIMPRSRMNNWQELIVCESMWSLGRLAFGWLFQSVAAPLSLPCSLCHHVSLPLRDVGKGKTWNVFRRW